MSGEGFLGKLIADLRDRHLLPVIGVVVVAIIAVPFLLHRSAPPPASVPETVVSADGVEAAVPAVLADTEGVRDYRRRLTELSVKNPFQDHFAPVSNGADASESTSLPASDPTASSGPSPGPTAPVPDTSAGSEASASAPAPSESTTASSTTSGTTYNNTTNNNTVKVKRYRVTYRADVKVGLPGELHSLTDVPALTFLPSKSRPTVVYVGADDSHERAVFMVSKDVTATTGEGSCTPSAIDCQFLALKPGERRTLTYSPTDAPERKVVVRLDAVRSVVVDRSRHTEHQH